MRLLAIGNSFSEDATTYLHCISGSDIYTENLYIGGCSLEMHAANIKGDNKAYRLDINGVITDKQVSIKDRLLEGWDIVTMQQNSPLSGFIQSYYPYVNELGQYISKYAPSAKQILHETWAYDIGSRHPAFPSYENNQSIMFRRLEEANLLVKEQLCIDILQSGKLIQLLREKSEFDLCNGGMSLCRDSFHLDLIYGRYAVAALWYEQLTRKSIYESAFTPPQAEPHLISIIKETVHAFVRQ